MALATGTGGYPTTDARAVGTMVTCCYGDTHELPSNSSRPDQFIECVTPFTRCEGEPV